MMKRLITAIVLILLLAPAIYIGGLYFLFVAIILSMIAAFEMMNMFAQKSKILKPYRFIIPIFSGLIVYMIYLQTIKHELIILNWIILIFLIAIIFTFSSLIFIKGSTAHDMMSCLMTLCYCGLIMGFVISIEYLEPTNFFPTVDGKWGRRSFTYLISIVVTTDTFAYFIGSKFGKHKLCPEISPKKSIEGAIGGLIAGGIFGTFFAFLLHVVDLSSQMVFFVFLFSILISITVQIGDLIASKLKRSYLIKDFGKIFPGHGGVLDRFDSLLFSGIVFYSLVQIIQLIGM